MIQTLKIGNVELSNRYILAPMAGVTAVSYTHLDVYKRQDSAGNPDRDETDGI